MLQVYKLMLITTLANVLVVSASDDCGYAPASSQLVIKGSYTDPGDWPWMTALFHRPETTTLQYMCGATLISRSAIVTAAHCVTEKRTTFEAVSIVAVMGRDEIYILTESQNAQTRHGREVLVHPSYLISRSKGTDLAVILLSLDITITDFVRPICTWRSSFETRIEGANGTVVGWGLNENGYPEEPRLTRMPLVSRQTCLDSHEDFHTFVHENQLCAGNRDGSGPCQGDSGSGMYMYVRLPDGRKRWALRGLVSRSLIIADTGDCDLTNYVVFTDMVKMVPWLNENEVIPTVTSAVKRPLPPTVISTKPPTIPPTRPPTNPPTRPPTIHPTRPPTNPPTRPPTVTRPGPPTNPPTRPPTNLPTVTRPRPPTNPPTRLPTNPPTRLPIVTRPRPPTNPPTRPPTNPPTRPPTNPPTRPPTVTRPGPPTNPPTRPPTNLPTVTRPRPPTNPPTRPSTNPPTRPSTNPPTRPPTVTRPRPPTNPPTRPPNVITSQSALKLIQLGNHRYYFSQDATDWYSAHRFCRSHGLELAELETQEENQLVVDQRDIEHGYGTWIGGTDDGSEGNWRWSASGRALGFTSWYTPNGQPDGGAWQNCIFICRVNVSEGAWCDGSCRVSQRYICEGA